MENSYKALMIAGGTLLGIMLLSVFVYVFREGAKASKSVEEAKIQQELIKENSRFEVYNRADNTVSDMVSLINLVYDYNLKRDFNENDCISLEIQVDDNTKYLIPKKDNSAYSLITNGVVTRNKVLKKEGTNTPVVVSVYELTTKPLANGDLLTKTHFDGKSTIYKYHFKATEFTYNIDSAHVESLKFEKYIINDAGSDSAWQSTWD